MDACLERPADGCGGLRDEVEQAALRGEHGLRVGERCAVELRQRALEHGKGLPRFGQGLLAPGGHVAAGERLGLEGRVVARRGEGDVQLASAAAERFGQGQVGAVCLFGCGRAVIRALEVERSLQVGQRVAPAVALVRHIGLKQAERHQATVGAAVLDHAHDRHAVREVGHLGEEAPDLELRVHTGPHTAVSLEEEPLAEGDDGVAARGLRAADGQLVEVGTGEFGVGGGRQEAQCAVGGAQLAALAHGRDHGAAEALVGEGVAHHAHGGLLADAGDGGGAKGAVTLFVAFLVGVFPGQRQRHEIGRGLGGAVEFEQRQQPAVRAAHCVALGIAPHRVVDEPRSLQGRSLGGIPALLLDVARQRVGLELRAGLHREADAPWHHLVAEDAVPAIEEHQHRPVFGRQHGLVPARLDRIGAELEPVEAVLGQREHVRQLADRREGGAAEQLDRHAPLEGREVQLGGLSRAREVGHAEDDFVFERPQVREHLAVAGFEEEQLPAAEGAARAADGEHAAHPVQKR